MRALALLAAAQAYLGLSAALLAASTAAPLSEAQRRWLEQEVFAIISSRERETFLELPAERRDDFVAAFWEARDPTPGTPRNELREEHQRRLAYADQYYGPSSARPGRQSDRGRSYILLGPPASLRRFESQLQLVPCELWFYGKQRRGNLPAQFWLLFFRQEGAGEYKLYSPIADGPRSLVLGDIASWLNPPALARTLKQTDGELAEAAYSLIPGERGPGNQPSFTGELLLARIDDLPNQEVDLSYLQRIGSSAVQSELAYAGLPLKLRADPLYHPEGWRLHYALEIPAGQVAFGDYQGKRYAALEVSGALRGPAGELAHSLRETVSLELGSHDHAVLGRSPLGFQDWMVIEPGEYRLELLARDRVGRRYASAAATVSVPPADTSFLGEPILVYRTEPRVAAADDSGYDWGLLRLKPDLPGLFLRDQTLGYLVQLRPPASGAWQLIERILSGAGSELRRAPVPSDRLHPAGGRIVAALGSVSLAGLEPGGYVLELELQPREGQTPAAQRASFEISPQDRLIRPKILYKNHRESRAAQLADRARLLAALGQEDRAMTSLEEARAAAPEDTSLARIASWARLKRQDYKGVLELAEPLLIKSPFDGELLLCAAAAAHELGELQDAVRYYERARAQRGDQPDLLNALGQTYAQVGNPQRARTLLNLSLEIDPDQPAVRELLNRLPDS
jgi:GWxTD domain-containing protein